MNKRVRGSIVFLAALIASVASLTAGAATNIWQGTVNTNWFEPGNWSLGVVPASEAEVLIPVVTAARAPWLTNSSASLAAFTLASNQVLNVAGWTSSLTAREMTIGGIIRHATNLVSTTNALGEWVPEHRIWLKGSNITLKAGSRLEADYRGYPVNAGPGRSGVASGAGHAGSGARSPGGLGGPPYGDPAAPEQPGSGGGGANSVSRMGGGAIRVEAEGVLTVSGTLTAKGMNGLASHGSGGSGGSVWLTCRTLAGSVNGQVAVDGGGGDRDGSGSSGGRIAVQYNQAEQALLPGGFPPIRFSGKPGYRGSGSERLLPGMGSLYLPDTNMLGAAFTAKRFQEVKLVIPDFTNWTPDTLVLDDCILGLPDGFRLTVGGNLVLTNGGGLHLYASAVTNPLLEAGASLKVGGNLAIYSNSWLFPYALPSNGTVVAIAVTGDFTVAAGGGVDADYKGFTYGQGPGSSALDNPGGGYGGAGSDGFDGDYGGGSYGSADDPVQPGSGGGLLILSGQGGGLIRVVAGGRAVIEGTLTANGAAGIATHGPAGSGGGVSLTCQTFEGTTSGLIRAEGALGDYYGGSGGGGRIAVRYNPAAQAALAEPCPLVRFSTFAYTNSSRSSFPFRAEMGTLYFPDTQLLAPAPTTDVKWAGQRFWHVRLAIPGFTNWAPRSLSVSNCAVRFPDGFRLSTAGPLTVGRDASLFLYAAPTNAAALFGSRLEVGGDLSIETNGWLIVQVHPTNGAVAGVRVEGNAAIEAGGGINADGRGFNPVSGNGIGPGPGRNSVSAGGYGGQGGGALGGYSNGAAAFPVGPGSAGGWAPRNTHCVTGPGGGAIRLMVGGALRLDGTLTADGYDGVYYRGPGGSGGGVFVSSGRMSGTGVIRARGGSSAYSTTGSGGGGRIAVWLGTPLAAAETAKKGFPIRWYTYQGSTIPTFTGALQVDPGGFGVAGGSGTAGFYRFSTPGALMLVK